MARRLSVKGEPIRLADDERARSLLDLARRSVTRHEDRVAYTWKPSRRAARVGGQEAGWRSVTFGELWAWIERVAAGLEAWGVVPGDRVAIMSRSRPEWLVCDLAAMSLGAVTCPIYHAERDPCVAFIIAEPDLPPDPGPAGCGARLEAARLRLGDAGRVGALREPRFGAQ
jgi:acyl-CoA synthetase (AMP-forming)/AMP-acid ligase II